MSAITIREVKTKADKLAFLKVPFEIYKNDVNWVAPLFFERMEHLDLKKNPYFQHAEAQLFIASRDGKDVGRISAQIDLLHIERYNDATGQFGFLEAHDDPEIFKALFQTAEHWLRAKGMKRVLGPFCFSINDELGLLIDGFDTPANMMMAHAVPYYAAHVEANGFKKIKDLVAYIHDRHTNLPPAFERIYKRGLASGDVKLRPINKKDMKNEINIIMDIFNDAWSDNWNFVPFTNAELLALATNFKMLVKNEAVQIAYYRGEPAAMIVSLPNLNEWIKGLNGKLLPFGIFRLIGKLISKKSKTFRVPLMGVKKKYQDSFVGSALAFALMKTVFEFHKAEGAESGEMSWILEDNKRIRSMLEATGSHVYKTYRVYEKSL
jgi:hypothetical protein